MTARDSPEAPLDTRTVSDTDALGQMDYHVRCRRPLKYGSRYLRRAIAHGQQSLVLR